jgi:hypothetical protein
MAARRSPSATLRSARAELDASAKEVSSLAGKPDSATTGPLDLALSSDDVLDRLAAKIVKARAQPDVYYIPTSTSSTWVVFLFPPMLPPLTFRVSVDLGARTVGAIEDPYIRNRLS